MTSGKKTIRDAFQEASFVLAEKEDAAKEAMRLLAFSLHLEIAQVYARMDSAMDDTQVASFFALCDLRKAGIPYQYITKEAEFMGFSFAVNEAVLIPRPETEHLVEIGLQHLKNLSKERPEHAPLRVLDLCTGSGCVAVAIAKINPDCTIVASDLSKDALALARENALRNEVEDRITFVQSDLFENIQGPFDLILSNPPYIPSEDLPRLQAEVKREPALALDGGEDGLDFYRIIASHAEEHLSAGGLLALECGIGQAEEIKKLFENDNNEFSIPVIGRDYAGIERNLSIFKNCIQ
ncbi:MAG: peptide chain release factor N(5)-glutamine methyltransferase [Clostridia bacterium]